MEAAQSELLTKTKETLSSPEPVLKLYKRRWIILFLYILYSGANSFQWMEYSIITNIITKYYNVSSIAVDWTSIIYMALYPIMVVPCSYLIDKKGLRIAGIVGCLGTTLAAAIKVFSINPNNFFVVLIGQAIGSAAQVFILCLPSKIAAVWFKTSEMARICSLAIFGTQIGFALGFIAPSSLVKNHDVLEDIGSNLNVLCWSLTVFMVPVTLGVLFFFPKQPKIPPSLTQYEERKRQVGSFHQFIIEFKKLLLDKAFCFHMIAYGINLGVFSAVGTFLNQFILHYFPNAEEDAGRMGLIMVIFGIAGSLSFGYVLDKTHKYKEITLFIYFMTFASVIIFMLVLKLQSMWMTYIASIFVGIFTSAYIPVGFEFAVELTFPSDESTTTGVLIAMGQLLGVFFTVAVGKINMITGPFWSLGSQAGVLLFGLVLTILTPNKLKRQAVINKKINNNPLKNIL